MGRQILRPGLPNSVGRAQDLSAAGAVTNASRRTSHLTRSVIFTAWVNGSQSLTHLSAPPLARSSPVRLKARP